MIESFFSPVADGLALTLLHFLWQGLLIAIVYGALLAATDVRSTRLRYVTSLLTFGVLALCPLVTFMVIYDSADAVDEIPTVAATATSTTRANTLAAPVITHQTGSTSAGQQIANEIGAELGQAGGDHRGFAVIQWAMVASQPFVLFLWLAGVMLSGARLTAGILNVRLLRFGRTRIPPALANRSAQFATRLGLTSARVFASARIREAGVVGFWRPVVLLPASWLTSLPSDVLEAVIAHELAHIRRYDVWVNLFQRVVETLLFYHPVVWWLSNRIRLEREMCCDELAVEVTGDRGNYVIALEQVGRLQVRGTLSLATSFRGERNMKLLSRVQNVLKTTGKPQREPAWLVGVIAVVLPLLILEVGGLAPTQSVAVAQERGAESERSAEAKAGLPQSVDSEKAPRPSAESKRVPQSTEASRGRFGEKQYGFGSTKTFKDFKPQTERETALFNLAEQLHREMTELRGEIQSQETDERNPDYPKWSIQIAGDQATVQANKQTKSKFIEATISALKESGVKGFTIRVQKKPVYITGTEIHELSIRMVDGDAEVSPSYSLPLKYIVAIIQQLQEAGVQRIVFTTPGRSKEEATAYPVSDLINPIHSAESPQRNTDGRHGVPEGLGIER